MQTFSAQKRLAILKKASKKPRSIAQICKEEGISRKTFYKWKKRLTEASPGARLASLKNKKREFILKERYFRQTTKEQEEAVLKIVLAHPEYSTAKISAFLPMVDGRPWLGNHGVQNVLKRLGLSHYQARLAYVKTQEAVFKPVPAPTLAPVFNLPMRIFRMAIAPFATIPKQTWAKVFAFSFLSTFFLSTSTHFWLAMVRQAPQENKIGLIFATISIACGTFFFLYSMKYYLTLAIVLGFSRHVGENGGNGKGYTGGLQPNLDHIKLERKPFVSIHLPIYNERKVVDRLLTACTSLDYENYEVIVVDDSTDETTKILEDWKGHPRVKVIHRESRAGFKGGALKVALENTDPKAEFVLVFDADFIPYPDTISQFLKYFQSVAGTLTFINPKSEILNSKQIQNSNDQNSKQFRISDLGFRDFRSNIAAVQGYQWHVLNKSENWITRGVRSEYAGNYVVERSGAEVLGALKMIAGSVYMIRADLLRKYGWGTSITEDFELTLRLYQDGYKVVYTPYVQGPAECVATIKRLVRQRMRWAEGHSHNIRKMAVRLLFGSFKRSDLSSGRTSPGKEWVPSKLTLVEKLEFLYLSPYYLQAFFFMIGTFSWLISETVFRARLPFWTSLWGWSLVLTNLFSLPLVNTVGLFLEESEERDYLGVLSFVFISYLLVPFQAYASIKGFLEKEEGPWFRTPKTGKITDIFTRGRFYRWISGILPGRIAPAMRMNTRMEIARMDANIRINSQNLNSPINSYLALATANNRFDKPPPLFDQSKQFAFLGVKVARRVVFSKATLALLLVVTMFLNYLAVFTVETGKKGEKVEKVEMVEMGEKGGGTEIFRGEPVNTNLIENKQATSFESGVVYAAESERGEIYRWQVKLPRETTYSFGLQESRGIRPVVKMENEVRGGNFVRFEPYDANSMRMGIMQMIANIRKDSQDLNSYQLAYRPKVEGNQIEWEIKPGLKAKYTSLADRIKADYVIERKASSVERLAFRVNFSDEEESPRIFEQNKDGSISLILDNYSQEIFRFLKPTVEDAEGKEGHAQMNIQKTGQGTAILTITLDPAFLASATYPITIDPTTLNSSAASDATAYGSQRHIIRDSYGKLLVVYRSSTYIYARWSNDNGATWQNELALRDNSGFVLAFAGTVNFSIAIDENKLYMGEEGGATLAGQINVWRWTIERDGSNNITGLGSSNNGWADAAKIVLDSSAYAYRPSLIVTKMGSNDHVAVAWSFYGQSGGTKSGGARFMHCKLSNDCTSLDNWCGANANTGSGECGTAATSLTAHGDADPIMVAATKTARHVVLNQQSPTGTGTYAKDLVVVLGDDAATTLGTGSTGWGDTADCGDGTTNCWATWSSDVDNVTGTQYDDADGFNLTLAQDNKNKELVLSYHDTTNSHLEALRLGQNDQPYAATTPWEDLTFPTGDNKDPTVGVDNTDGIYYNFYKNASGYIAFRQADGVNFGDKLGYETVGSSTADIQNTIRGSKFTLSAEKIFTRIKLYTGGAAYSHRAAIYIDDGGSPSKPGTLVAQTGNFSGAAAEWKIAAFDTPVRLNSGTYWLVANSDAYLDFYYNTGSTNQGISASQTCCNFPVSFPSSTNDNNQYSIYAEVGWSGEIVLYQTNADDAYPSVSEASDTTNKKMDLIYTQGTTTWAVYYHTWHFEQRYSRGKPTSLPSGYDGLEWGGFLDEKGYDNVESNDGTRELQIATGGYPVFLFKVKNTDRTNKPQINPTWDGQSGFAPSSYPVYLQIYDRNSASWAACDSDNSTGADTDFDLTCTKDTNLDYYYFADDWVYFRVYQDTTGDISLKTDYFNPSPFIVPEKTLLTLFLLAIFLPKIVRRLKCELNANKNYANLC